MSDAMGAALRDAAERLFDGRNYSHAPIWRQVQGLSAEQALWRPSRGRQCIWEIVRHIAFWRQHFMDSLAGRPAAPLGQDWSLPARPDAEGRFERFAQVAGYLEREATTPGRSPTCAP